MSGATIIRLEPSMPATMPRRRVEAATFEEAFGDFSEARGDRRKKRQARRMDRIKNRDERLRARREGKIKRRSDRKKLRLESRGERKRIRQTTRGEQMESRLGRRQRRGEARNERRMTRERGRQERENYVQEQELFREGREPKEPEELDDDLMDTQEGEGQEPLDKPSGDSGSSAPSGDSTGYSDDSQDSGGGYSDDSQDSGSSQDSDGGYSDQGYADEGYADEGYADEGYGNSSSQEEAGNYSDEEEMGEYSSEDEGYTDGFDGVTLSDDSFSEMADASTTSKVSPPAGLIELCNKIEWNKELISRLEEKRKSGASNKSEISKNIIERKKRLADLQSNLDMYLGFAADFSSADGRTMISSRRSKRPTKGQMRSREVQVANARMKAMQMRAYGLNKNQASMSKRDGGDVTPVDVELQPEIKKQRIVIPPSSPSSSASGTGIMGLDNSEDFGARELDIRLAADGGFDLPMNEPYSPFSHLDGDTFSYTNGDEKVARPGINWGAVLVGVAVGAAAIWAVRKYKLLDK